jgi:hypothetical protein
LCVPRGIGGLGFLCMLEALCAVLVYSLWRFFLVYNTLTYQKKKKKARLVFGGGSVRNGGMQRPHCDLKRTRRAGLERVLLIKVILPLLDK